MAVANNASVAPAGMAWKAVIDDDPTIELYTGDGSHPNINGSYLTACVMYASIFQKSPVGISFHSTIDAELALYLQEKAHVTVFNDLDLWRIGLNDLTSNFSFTNDGLNFTFTNLSTEATSWNWEIDGTSYTEENPTHSFATAGTYDVTLTSYNACDTASYTETINTGSVAIESYTYEAFYFYPNPANNWLYFNNPDNLKEVMLFNLAGELVVKINPTTPFNTTQLNKGIYFILAGNKYFKLIKS